MSILVQIRGPCGRIHVPWCHAEHRGAVSPGTPLGSGGCCRVCVLFWFLPPRFDSLSPPHNLPGFHPLPLSSTGFSTLFPRTVLSSKDAQGQMWAEIFLFHASLLLQHPVAAFLCPSASSSRSEQQCCSRLCRSGSASPLKPINQSLDAICLLQHVKTWAFFVSG